MEKDFIISFGDIKQIENNLPELSENLIELKRFPDFFNAINETIDIIHNALGLKVNGERPEYAETKNVIIKRVNPNRKFTSWDRNDTNDNKKEEKEEKKKKL